MNLASLGPTQNIVTDQASTVLHHEQVDPSYDHLLAKWKIHRGVYPDATKLHHDLFPHVSVRSVRSLLIKEGLPGQRR